MKKISLIGCFSVVLLVSACASDIKSTLGPPPEPRQSNAEMVASLQKAVERCVGMGLNIGSTAYEYCVKRQLQ
jgi:hypothetical protein